MGIYILIFFAVFAFSFFAFARKWHDYAMLFTFAIGCAVNANILNSVSVPVYVGNLIFSIDSILYTLFMFTVIICAKDYDIRRAKILTSSAIAAILVSAVIEFFANLSAFGYTTAMLVKFMHYVLSCLGTFVGVWIMLLAFKKLQNKNINMRIAIILCVALASIINTAIYYTGVILISGSIQNLAYVLLGSAIGKICCIFLGELAYYVNTHYWIPNNLKDKYPENKNNNLTIQSSIPAITKNTTANEELQAQTKEEKIQEDNAITKTKRTRTTKNESRHKE